MLGSHVSRFTLFVLLSLGFVLPALADTPAEERADIRKQSSQILSALYKAKPHTRDVVKRGVGYATFSNFGMKILLAGGGSGHGMVVEKATKRETFMKMVEVQAGLGFGIKKFRVIFVFDTQKAMNDFVNQGWEFGGQQELLKALTRWKAKRAPVHSDAVSVPIPVCGCTR